MLGSVQGSPWLGRKPGGKWIENLQNTELAILVVIGRRWWRFRLARIGRGGVSDNGGSSMTSLVRQTALAVALLPPGVPPPSSPLLSILLL